MDEEHPSPFSYRSPKPSWQELERASVYITKHLKMTPIERQAMFDVQAFAQRRQRGIAEADRMVLVLLD